MKLLLFVCMCIFACGCMHNKLGGSPIIGSWVLYDSEDNPWGTGFSIFEFSPKGSFQAVFIPTITGKGRRIPNADLLMSGTFTASDSSLVLIIPEGRVEYYYTRTNDILVLQMVSEEEGDDDNIFILKVLPKL